MKNISIYSDIRQYITKTLILPDNLFLLIFSNGLLYSIINLFPHTTFCLVGNITLLLINIYIARCILNKKKRLIPGKNDIQELQNQREIDILLTDSIEEKIRMDFKYKKEIKEQKRLYISEAYVFLVFIFLTNILSILNNISSFHLPIPPHTLYLLFQISLYVLYSAIILRLALSGIKLIPIIALIIAALISICSIIISFPVALPFVIISGFILYYIVYLFNLSVLYSIIILKTLITFLIINALSLICSIIMPFPVALLFVIILGVIFYIDYIFTIKNKYHGRF